MDKIKGTGVALVTPFESNKSVDYKALENLLNYVIDGGIDYLVLMGTTGESSSLTRAEKIDILAFSKKIILLSMKLFEILDDENILNNAKLRTIVASVLAIYFKNKNLKVSRKLIGGWINIKENRVHNMINNHNHEVCLLVEKLNSITD